MIDFRARCAELVAAMESYPLRPKAHRDLCSQVRTELEQDKPTDQELLAFAHAKWLERGYREDLGGVVHYDDLATFARAVLAKWGRS